LFKSVYCTQTQTTTTISIIIYSEKVFCFVLKSSRVSVPIGHGLIVAKQKTKEEKKSKLDAQTQIRDGALEIIISLRLTCAFIVK